jgi:hypothetical protein
MKTRAKNSSTAVNKKNSSRSRRMQGCQIFLVPKYPNEENYTKLPQNVPNGHKIFPMAVK